MTMTTPDGRVVEVNDIGTRQLILPVGTTVQVPEKHTWFIVSMSALPNQYYTPPLGAGELRDVRSWGDVQICINGQPHFRTNVVTLMDRYWGRYNLNPQLPEITAKLTQAQQALYTAPKIAELAKAMEYAQEWLANYLTVASPKFESPLQLSGGSFTIEHVACDALPATTVDYAAMAADTPITVPIQVTSIIDVELLLMIRRPIA